MDIRGCCRGSVGRPRSNHLIFIILLVSQAMGSNAESLAEGRKYVPMTRTSSLPQARVPTGTTSAATAAWAGGLLIPLDGSFTVVPFSGYSPPLYRNDDGSSGAIPLAFPFCFYGTNYSSVYINNNGTVSFGGPYSDYTPTGFPTSGYGMVAPFWADVDTRSELSGVVYYRSEPHRFVVIWDHVGYYSSHDDKLNTFEVILTDGTDPLIGIGENIEFSYADMQWTTGDASDGVNGFGGVPATVGANRGNGTDYAPLGRFDHEGIDYDGPAGNNDGVSYLDGKVFPFDVCLGTGMISGTVFDDANCNGARDPGEVGLPGRMIVLDPGGRATFTEPDGDFTFSFLNPDVYTLQLVPRGGWIQTLPPSGGATVNLPTGQTVNGVDFGAWAFQTASNLHVSVEGSRARPGFDKTFAVDYRNNGTATVAATVTLWLPSQVEYVASTDGGLYVAAMHSVVWNIGELPPDGFGRRKATALVPSTVPLSTFLYATARIDPTTGDIDPDDNLSCEVQLVRSGFDPNDKEVRPGATIDRLDTLRYKINFQNVGNDTAFNITIRDTLDANCDIATLVPRACSHPCDFGITGSRELFWTFTNICLPDSTENETASHGFVAFEVLPVAGLPVGTVFSNQAAVYFDFNAPVLTNVVTSQLVGDQSVELVAHLTFDEGSGTIAHDASGHGNDGTLLEGAGWAPGIFGNALSLDGVNDYVRIPDSESLDIDAAGITFGAWVNSPGFHNYGWIMGKGSTPWDDMVWWLLPKADGGVRYGIKSGGTIPVEREVAAGLSTNTWEHVAVVYNGVAMMFYLNGEMLDSWPKTGTMNANDKPVLVGLDGFNPANHYFGLIDDLRIYSRGLTVDELREASGMCGDLNRDGLMTVVDVVTLINHVFRSGPEPDPRWSADVRCDGAMDVLDVVLLVDHVFRGGDKPTCRLEP